MTIFWYFNDESTTRRNMTDRLHVCGVRWPPGTHVVGQHDVLDGTSVMRRLYFPGRELWTLMGLPTVIRTDNVNFILHEIWRDGDRFVLKIECKFECKSTYVAVPLMVPQKELERALTLRLTV